MCHSLVARLSLSVTLAVSLISGSLGQSTVSPSAVQPQPPSPAPAPATRPPTSPQSPTSIPLSQTTTSTPTSSPTPVCAKLNYCRDQTSCNACLNALIADFSTRDEQTERDFFRALVATPTCSQPGVVSEVLQAVQQTRQIPLCVARAGFSPAPCQVAELTCFGNSSALCVSCINGAAVPSAGTSCHGLLSSTDVIATCTRTRPTSSPTVLHANGPRQKSDADENLGIIIGVVAVVVVTGVAGLYVWHGRRHRRLNEVHLSLMGNLDNERELQHIFDPDDL